MAHLVMRYHVSFMRIQEAVLFLETRNDPFDRLGEIIHCHDIGTTACRRERRFVHEVGEIGAGESWRQGRDFLHAEVSRRRTQTSHTTG
jgi:hypothetical protein